MIIACNIIKNKYYEENWLLNPHPGWHFIYNKHQGAQTQKGNVLVGAQRRISGGTFQDEKRKHGFSLNLSPQAGWFIKDDLAIGPMVNLGLTTGNGSTTFTYGVGAFGRYYIKDKSIEVLDKTRWFLEANGREWRECGRGRRQQHQHQWP